MPPSSGHKYRLPGLLDKLVDFEVVPVLLADAWQHVYEIVDRLVILSCTQKKVKFANI